MTLIDTQAEKIAAPAPESYVYMFYSAGRVKIGTSIDPVRRLDALNNSSPSPVQLIWIGFGDRRREELLHQMFDVDRLHGEWFNLSDGIRSFINMASTEAAPFREFLRAAEMTNHHRRPD